LKYKKDEHNYKNEIEIIHQIKKNNHDLKHFKNKKLKNISKK
jgi:hypothetical protein